MKIIAAILLLIIAIVMVYIGISNNILPPALTGVGFLIIGVLFLLEKKPGNN